MIRLAAAFALLLAAASPAGAHSAGWRASDARAVVLDFAYGDGEPMAFADARLFAPGASEPALVARTDAAGRFAFVPTAAGEWRVEVRDHENHTVRAEVTIDADGVARRPSPWGRWLLWASLMVNIGGLAWWLNRRRVKAEAAGDDQAPRASTSL